MTQPDQPFTVGSSAMITASKLYNYIQCEHRVWRDANGPTDERSPEVNPFVQLLWERGIQHEEDIIRTLGDYEDLSSGTLHDRIGSTKKEMDSQNPLIYQGVICHDNLLGIPDLLAIQADGTYLPVDIKSGSGFEGVDEEAGQAGRPKKRYAVQLALYAEVLIVLGYANDCKGNVIDISANEVEYDLNQVMGSRTTTTFWQYYLEIKECVRRLISDEVQNYPALCGACKLCPWHDSCKNWVASTDDATGVFYLGRRKRDVLRDDASVNSISDILTLDINELLTQKKQDKSFLKGLAKKSLEQFVRRANILKNTKKPVMYESFNFPSATYELFLDIEDDPTQEFVYLHGIYERTHDQERYLSFCAQDVREDSERDVWSAFWEYIDSLPTDDYAVYYYSSHERSTYTQLQRRFPNVVSEERVESFFAHPNVIDLYFDVVYKYTDWPLASYSLKSLAVFLGFKWRDETPSGALSIQWFNDYIDTGDREILKRILLYNEDDCKATMVLKDALAKLSHDLT